MKTSLTNVISLWRERKRQNQRKRTFFIASGCPIATTSLYRCVHLQEQLSALGHDATVLDWFNESKINPEEVRGYDVIVLYRLAMGPGLAQVIDQTRRLGQRLIFDTDDLVFEPELVAWHRAVQSLSPDDQIQHLKGVRKYLETLLACDAVTVTTPLLAEFVTKRGKSAYVHRNALGREMKTLAEELDSETGVRGRQDRVVIGYGSGTATHDIDFLEASPALENVLDRFPFVELWIAGPLSLPVSLERFSNRIRRFPLTAWQDWFQLMARMDIALAPLEMGNVFCRAKSEIKFVEAGALGLPVVASKIDPYQESFTHGRDGYLASNQREWTDALSALVKDGDLRRRIGNEARRTVEQRYGPEARTRDLANLLRKL